MWEHNREEKRHLGVRPESGIHRLYRHVLEMLLVLFLIITGVEFLLEKAEPVVYRWHALVRALANRDRLPPSKGSGASASPPIAREELP
jgi:hypothetical protein